MSSITNLYLTSKEQKVFSQLDPVLANAVTTWVEHSDPKARKVLSSFLICDSSLHPLITNFFLKMIKDVNEKNLFEEFSKIHGGEGTRNFFEFASTRALRDLSLVFNDYKKTRARHQMVQTTQSWESLCQKIPFTVLERQRLLECLRFFSSSAKPAELDDFIEEMKRIYSVYGEELSSTLTTAIREQQVSFPHAIWMLKRLHAVAKTPPLKEIDQFVQGRISCDLLSKALQETNIIDDPSAWDVDALPGLINRFKQMPFPLSNQGLQEIETQFKSIQSYCKLYANLGIETLSKNARLFAEKGAGDKENQAKILSLGVCALRYHFGYHLHPTQVLTVLGQLSFPDGSLAQVKTGEGKSMIVALLGFFLAIQGKSVHIVSSASNLSIRDQMNFQPFFSSFGITTSHICDQNPAPGSFKGQILYGTGHDFEFAIMREMLNLQLLFQEGPLKEGEKRFDCVIVDEVDNLTIDTLRNEARIASPAEISYDWVYTPILTFVQNNRQGTLSALKAYLSQYEGGRFRQRSSTLGDQQLQMWLRSANHAQYELKQNIDYVVLPTSKEKEICILDAENTGRLMHGCRWGGGIHEFVETKHSIPVKRESLTPIALSHPVYYGMYRGIFGLSGTLGSAQEREEILRIYQIHTFDVPTFLPSKRKDFPPVIVSSEETLLETVLVEIQHMKNDKRPTLVICNSIAFSDKVSQFLAKHRIDHELLNEMQDKSEEVIIQQAGLPGMVTVATNTASRGTDIKLSRESIDNGGLSVITTFFPKSLRVEEQIRGRAGRQGQPGSSKIYFTSSLSLEETIEERERRTSLSKEIHIYIAKLAKHKFQFVQRFFAGYAQFRQSREAIIEKLTIQWTPRKRLRAQQPDLSKLSPKDRALAVEAIHLLDTKQADGSKWKTLIGAVHERIDQLTMENWARRFYSAVENKFRESGMETLISVKEFIDNGFFHLVMDVKINEIYTQLTHEMNVLFSRGAEEGYWNSYLSADGLNKYLKEVISGTQPGLLSFAE